MCSAAPLSLALLALLVGCAEPTPAATPAAEELAPVERGPEYDFPLGQRLFDLWREDAPHAHATSSLHRGRLAPGRPAENLVVLTGVRCYQILAVVERPTPGLRLTLFDPTGVPQVRAEGDSDSLSLGHDEPICPGAPGRYRLRLEGDGETAYALRVYGAMSL
ncbi:MAG: hypothetical protein GXP55_02155 [Deltaproteobacteria bacterium]|nr:hypothetical protein [Deltaproteobacteria bacterium]